MRIAFDHHAFCGQSYGGVSRYFVRLADELLAAGEEVEIFAPLHRNAYLSDLPPGTVRGVGVQTFPPYTSGLIRKASRYVVRPAIRRWRPDVVHETYFSMSGTAPPGCPMVLTVFDMTHERNPGKFPRGDRTTLNKRSSISRADHVVCISEHTRRDLIDLFEVPSNNISVVHLGVDLPAQRPRRSDKPLSVRPRPFLLYVGSRLPYKNFDQLVRAVAGSTGLKGDFDIVAFGGGRLTAQEQALISSEGLGSGRVHQLGGSDSILSGLFSQAAALVYPSFYEGFGLPPLEAMAHRCPVISSNSSSMPEVIGDAGEYFDPYDARSLAEAIARVVYSPQRAGELIDLGLRRVSLFTWRRCALQTLQTYRMVVG